MLPRRDGILGGGGPAAQSTAAPVALRPPASRRSTALATTVTAVLATAVPATAVLATAVLETAVFPTAVRATAVFPTAVLATAVRATAVCATAVLATAVLPQLCSRRRVRVVGASTVLQLHGRRLYGGWFYVTERMGGGGGWQRQRGDVGRRRNARCYAPGVAPSRYGGATCAAPVIPRLHARSGAQQAPQFRAWAAQYSAGLLRRGWFSPCSQPAGV